MADRISDAEQKALCYTNSLHFKTTDLDPGNDTSDHNEDSVSGKAPAHDLTLSTPASEEEMQIHDGGPQLANHLVLDAVYTLSNVWPKKRAGKVLKQKASRKFIHGVEMRTLTEPHFLSGQTGLFAAIPFEQFDIVGEYCGEVLAPPRQVGGQYTAVLEDNKEAPDFALCVNSQYYGNECRAINHYEKIADAPNVVMQICYVEELPRIMIVCKRNIEVGEELLLDYGEDYVKQFFRKQD